MAHPSGRTQWGGVLFGLAVAVLGAYQQLKLPPVLPEMLDVFGYPKLLAGAFMSVFAVAGLALSLKVGRLMQLQGTPRFLGAAAGLAILGSLLILAAPGSGWTVLAGRALEGTAMAVLAVAGPTIMTRNVGPHHLPVAAALAATWIPLGGLLASAVARTTDALVPGSALWPAVFWAGIGFSALVALGAWRLSRPGSAIDLKAPVPQQAALAPDPARRTALILAGLCFFFWATQNMAVLTWLPAYLAERWGLDGGDAAALYALPIAMVALFNLVAIPLLKWGWGLARLLAVALVGQAALFALVAATPIAEDAVVGIALLALYGALAGVTPTCLYGLPAAILGGARTGAGAFGVLMTGRNMGVLSGPLMAAALIQGALFAQWDGGWGAAAAAVAASTLASAVVAGLLIRRLARLPAA
ncbi:MAG: MFS transporter [Alphaproteobacteria bacterium]|nr:MFS transporter [Alphaproteobacteria bacterium]